jgi:hypothetical protein
MYEVGEGDSKIRYCFITNIDKGNGLVSITYELDVWHTYAPFMKVRDGVLGRARIGTDTLKRALPVAYESNGFQTFSATTAKQFYLAAEISAYVVTADAEKAETRVNYTCLIGNQKNRIVLEDPDVVTSPVIPYKNTAEGLNYYYDIDEAIEAINLLTAYQGMENSAGITYAEALPNGFETAGKESALIRDKLVLYSEYFTDTITKSDKEKNIRYELTQVYAIPLDYPCGALWNTATTPNIGLRMPIKSELDIAAGIVHLNMVSFGFMPLFENVNTISFNQTIAANPLTGGYGLYSTLVPLPYNNRTYTIKHNIYATNYGLAFVDNFLEGMQDITNQFEIPLPFTTLSGADRQQKAIAKQMSRIQLWTTIGVTAASLIGGIGTAAAGAKLAGAAGASTAIS